MRVPGKLSVLTSFGLGATFWLWARFWAGPRTAFPDEERTQEARLGYRIVKSCFIPSLGPRRWMLLCTPNYVGRKVRKKMHLLDDNIEKRSKLLGQCDGGPFHGRSPFRTRRTSWVVAVAAVILFVVFRHRLSWSRSSRHDSVALRVKFNDFRKNILKRMRKKNYRDTPYGRVSLLRM